LGVLVLPGASQVYPFANGDTNMQVLPTRQLGIEATVWLEAPLYTVINSQGDWQTVWNRGLPNYPRPFYGPSDAPVQVPYVDFGTEFLIIADWGPKPDGCYNLKIVSVTRLGNTVTVRVRRQELQSWQFCTDGEVEPKEVIAIAKSGFAPGGYTFDFVDTDGNIFTTIGMMLP